MVLTSEEGSDEHAEADGGGGDEGGHQRVRPVEHALEESLNHTKQQTTTSLKSLHMNNQTYWEHTAYSFSNGSLFLVVRSLRGVKLWEEVLFLN